MHVFLATGKVSDRAATFYGWWIVAACLVSSLFANALGLYGAGVNLHTVTEKNGWSTGLVSGAVTLFYIVSALLLILVGTAINHYGPKPVIGLGALSLSAGVIGIGQAGKIWQICTAFLVMGVGWSCLSMTAVTTALAPWFERVYGRAVSVASLGASFGGMAARRSSTWVSNGLAFRRRRRWPAY